jgi:hypothetical protein
MFANLGTHMFFSWRPNILNCKSCVLKYQDQELLSTMLSTFTRSLQLFTWSSNSSHSWTPNVCHHAQNSLHYHKANWVHTLNLHFFNTHFNITSPCTPGSPERPTFSFSH